MEKIPLQITSRTAAESVKEMRRLGQVPGVVYGNTDNTLIKVNEVALKKAYVKAGESTLVELDTDGTKLPVLFHMVDFHPVSDRMIHVDFYAVDMKREVTTEVHVRFENEAPAVKELGAILVTALHEVTVKALPANLPHDLPIDLGKLMELGSTLTVADIPVPEGVTIMNDPEEVVAIAQKPREEEVEATPAPAEGAAAEGVAPADGADAEGAPAAAGEGKKEG